MTTAPGLRRRRGGRRPHPRPRPPHPGADLPAGERRARRRAVLQVRELPADGRVQVPRRVQRAVPVRRRTSGGPGWSPTPRATTRRPSPSSARILDIPAVIVMPHDAPASKVAATRGYGARIVAYDRYTEDREEIGRTLAAEQRADPDPALRPPGHHRRPGHGHQGADRAGRPAGRAVRLPGRRRAALRCRAGRPGAVPRVPALRRGAGGRRRRAAVAAQRLDRAHRHAADHRRRRPDPAPGRAHVRDHPPRGGRHPHRHRRRAGRGDGGVRQHAQDRRRADRLPGLRRGPPAGPDAGRSAGRRAGQRGQRRSRPVHVAAGEPPCSAAG